MKVQVGDEFVSKFGTNLRLTVTAVEGKAITCVAERRTVDRKTGEILIEKRERIVGPDLWRHVLAGYTKG